MKHYNLSYIMKRELIDIVVTTALALSGGLAALSVRTKANKINEKISVKTIASVLFLCLCGAFIVAPAITEYYGLTGRVEAVVTFVVAIVSEIMVLFVLRVGLVFYEYAPEAIKKLIDKYTK